MRAEHHGVCDLCDDKIRPGDDIRREQDAWAHVDCLTRLEADVNNVLAQLGVSRPRCTTCADLLLANGTCPNCERTPT